MHVFSLARQALFAAGLFTFAAPVAASSPEQQFGAVADLLSAGKADDAMQTLAQLNAQSPDFHLGRQFYDELKARLAADTQPPLAGLADEARLRLASERAVPEAGTLPDSGLRLAASSNTLYQQGVVRGKSGVRSV